METYKINVHATFTEELLGTASANTELHSEYIASKAPDALKLEEEIEALGADAVEAKGMTVFPKDENGNPFLWDYQLKGFFKGACSFLRRVPHTKASALKSYKKQLDGLLFVFPRRIPLQLSGPLGRCQRPLRAETPQGERVALSDSETAPEGTVIDFTVECLTKEVYDVALEALEYGKLHGVGQWRNSGKGRFVCEIKA